MTNNFLVCKLVTEIGC